MQGIDFLPYTCNKLSFDLNFVFPDLVVRKADIELKSREEEIRFLNMEV